MSNSECWIITETNQLKSIRMRIWFICPFRPSEYTLLCHQSVRWLPCSQMLHTIHLVLILKWKPSVCFCRPPLTIAGWYVWEVSWGIIAPWARTRAWHRPGQRTQDGACDKLICDDLSSERRECDIYWYLVMPQTSTLSTPNGDSVSLMPIFSVFTHNCDHK